MAEQGDLRGVCKRHEERAARRRQLAQGRAGGERMGENMVAAAGCVDGRWVDVVGEHQWCGGRRCGFGRRST